MKIKTNKVTDCDRISPRAIKGLCPISEFFNPRTFKAGGVGGGGGGGGGGVQVGCHPLEFF